MKINLTKFTAKPKKIITALEIDTRWLRIIQVEYSKREKRVSAIIAKDVRSLSDDALSKIITDLSGKLKINSPHLITSIARALATTRNLEFPSTNPSEIKDMIELQIGKQTPYPSDEIIKDYQILDSNVSGYSRVLLVIVHRDIVQRYFKILKTAGLRVERVGFSSEGLLNWSRLFHVQKADTNRPYILIETDYDKSDFEIILNNKLIFSRSISLGFSQSQEAGELWQAKFIEEVNHSIYAYQNEAMDGEIDKIIISSPKMIGESLKKDVLEERFDLPVEIIDQFKNIPATKEALDSYNDSAQKDLSFSGLLGLAFTFGDQKIDLIPQELQIEKSVRERGKDLYFMGIFLVFILIAASGIFLGRMYNKERYSGQLKNQLRQIQAKTQKLNNMMGVIEKARARIRTRSTSLNLIYEAHRLISPEIHLVSLSFNGKDSLVLRGTSNVMSEVFDFVNRLEESEYFQNVKTKYATKHKVEDKELTDFEIFCPLEDKYKNIDKYGL